MDSDDLLNRVYSSFKGIDVYNDSPAYTRSPDALNMWKSYNKQDCIETRPGMNLIGNFEGKIYNIIHYNTSSETQVLVHAGTKLYLWENYPSLPSNPTILQENMNIIESNYFIYDNVLFILDELHYYEYDGTDIKEVEGTVPITSYYKNPDGSISIDADTDTDTVYQNVNVLTPYRINNFIADGESVNYQLDTTDLDPASYGLVEVTSTEETYVEGDNFSVDRENGIVIFDTAPSNQIIVTIKFRKTISGYRERVENCSLIAEFDNRIFFSGNQNFPNAIFHCELNDPRYVSDLAYYECGIDTSEIKSIIPGNGVLWATKDINQNSSSIYYLTPTIDATYGKIYPSVNGNISKGCISKGINYNDDIIFFSKDGLEGIGTSEMYSEQILNHKSTLIDNKMIYESEYKNVKLAEYNGYLLCLIDSKIYLADYRQRFTNNLNIEYEWYYWEMPNKITYIKEYRGELFMGNDNGDIYLLFGTKDVEEDIYNYWITTKDNFGYPSYTKTTNKRGNVANLIKVGNDEIMLHTIVDGVEDYKGLYSDATQHIIYKIKEKKFKDIQLKFSSYGPFALISCTLQGYVSGYMKK